MKIRNLEGYARDIPDPETGDTYQVAARPGVVELPDKLARNLLKQESWAKVDDKTEPKADAQAEKEKS